MKEAIEKAIGNGLFKDRFIIDKKQCLIDIEIEGRHPIEIWEEGASLASLFLGSLYDLTFGTDFIECLVEGRERICQENKQNCDADINEQCIGFQTPEFQNTCEYRITADYHREQMADMKDIEKLKDYVRGLV